MKQNEILSAKLELLIKAQQESKTEYQEKYASENVKADSRSNDWFNRWWDDMGKNFNKEIEETKRAIVKEQNREVEVGDGVTICLYSDRHAGTVIKRTPKTITVQRDKATLDPGFKPEFIPGGFCAHCTNSNEQKWTYVRDEKGAITVCRWSEKNGRFQFLEDGSGVIINGRHEYYDYNF